MKSERAPSNGSRGAARAEAPGLYVHVPYCLTKCPYCDFYSIVSDAGVDRWLDALEREMELYRGSFESFGAFDTLYVGGGTPSLLAETRIERLFEIVARAFPLAAGAEVTIEANPDDVTASKLRLWRDLGANRLSIGVQSFDDAELRFLRRRHDAAQARAAVALAREVEFANVGLDLIYGFAGQSLESWNRTMREAVSFSPEHLSCYQMTIEEETPFGRMREAGSLGELDEDAQRAFFVETSTFLASRGYVHYEISNFARGEGHVSRHNHKYWTHVPYLGLGPAAHSFSGVKRWWNARSVETYTKLLLEGGSPVDGMETLGEDDLAFEALYLGFRTKDGVPLAALERCAGWRGTLDRLVESSLIIVENGRVVPTLEGFCVADRLATAFAS